MSRGTIHWTGTAAFLSSAIVGFGSIVFLNIIFRNLHETAAALKPKSRTIAIWALVVLFTPVGVLLMIPWPLGFVLIGAIYTLVDGRGMQLNGLGGFLGFTVVAAYIIVSFVDYSKQSRVDLIVLVLLFWVTFYFLSILAFGIGYI